MEVKGNITYLLAALSALRAEIKSPSLEVVFRSISVTDRGWQLLQQQPNRAIKSDQDEKRTKLVEVFCTRLLEFTSRLHEARSDPNAPPLETLRTVSHPLDDNHVIQGTVLSAPQKAEDLTPKSIPTLATGAFAGLVESDADAVPLQSAAEELFVLQRLYEQSVEIYDMLFRQIMPKVASIELFLESRGLFPALLPLKDVLGELAPLILAERKTTLKEQRDKKISAELMLEAKKLEVKEARTSHKNQMLKDFVEDVETQRQKEECLASELEEVVDALLADDETPMPGKPPSKHDWPRPSPPRPPVPTPNIRYCLRYVRKHTEGFQLATHLVELYSLCLAVIISSWRLESCSRAQTRA